MISLDDIDFYNIGSWPKMLKVFVIGLSVLLIIIFFNWLFISSKTEELERLLLEEKKLRVLFTNKHKMLVNIAEYKNQMKEIQQRLSTLVQLLPSANEIPALVNQMSLAGKDSGLSFKEISVLPENKLKYYVELPIRIKVTGNYHQLGEFVSRVSSLPRIVTLHDLILNPEVVKKPNPVIIKSSENQETLVLDVLAKTYRYIGNNNQDQDQKINSSQQGVNQIISPVNNPAVNNNNINNTGE